MRFRPRHYLTAGHDQPPNPVTVTEAPPKRTLLACQT